MCIRDRVYKLDYGQEEAASVFGADPRQYAITTKRFVGDENGHVKEAHTVRIEWVKGDDGRFQMKESRAARRSGRPSSSCWPWASSARNARACSSNSR